jgi:diaminopimelate decarboxylase/aspartate kinase
MAYAWWHQRKDELIALAGRGYPCLVYNEETLNDILFDLLSMEGIEKVFFPVRTNAHPAVLEKARSMGTGFACCSAQELESLLGLFPDLSPERILLIPDPRGDEKMHRAFHSGVSVVLKSLDALWAFEDTLKGREILVWISSKPRDEKGLTDDGKPGIAPADMAALTEGVKTRQAGAVGLYASIEDFQGTNPSDVEWLSSWDGIGNLLEEPRVFVLAGVRSDLEGVDPAAAGRIVEALQERYPKAAIWLEPSSRIVSPAGGLLARGDPVVKHKDKVSILNDSGKKVVVPLGDKSPPHEVVNLSGLERGFGERPGVPADVLFITNMGAADTYSVGKKKLREAVSEHYLRARSICKVDWRLPKC